MNKRYCISHLNCYNGFMVTTTRQQKIGVELKAVIAHSVREVLEDPDFGLQLTERANRRLRAVRSRRQKWTPLSIVVKKYS